MVSEKNRDGRERRKHQRFQARKCTVAINAKLGQVIDISMGGLSFSYIDTGNWVKDSAALAILFGPDELSLDDFPMRIISDCSLGKGMSMLRRCGVEFGELTREQVAQLEHFIWVNSMLENGSGYSE